jgi:hypothetical protein
MRAAISPLSQYAFMAWCSVKAQGQLFVPFTFTFANNRTVRFCYVIRLMQFNIYYRFYVMHRAVFFLQRFFESLAFYSLQWNSRNLVEIHFKLSSGGSESISLLRFSLGLLEEEFLIRTNVCVMDLSTLKAKQM